MLDNEEIGGWKNVCKNIVNHAVVRDEAIAKRGECNNALLNDSVNKTDTLNVVKHKDAANNITFHTGTALPFITQFNNETNTLYNRKEKEGTGLRSELNAEQLIAEESVAVVQRLDSGDEEVLYSLQALAGTVTEDAEEDLSQVAIEVNAVNAMHCIETLKIRCSLEYAAKVVNTGNEANVVQAHVSNETQPELEHGNE